MRNKHIKLLRLAKLRGGRDSMIKSPAASKGRVSAVDPRMSLGGQYCDTEGKAEINRIHELANETETIDDMSPRILKMFVFIKKQLMHPDHPLNVIAKKFVESYV